MRKAIFLVIILLGVILSAKFYIGYNDDIVETPSLASLQVASTTPKLTINFLDIGQGDASLIQFPNGEKMLVDCAVDSRILPALGRTLDFYDRTIDYLVITHPDLDHYGGCVDVLNRFQVKNIIYNGLQKDHDSFWQVFWQAVQAEGAKYYLLDNELSLNIASSSLDFIFPDQPVANIQKTIKSTDKGDNNSSIVFVLNYFGKKVLFTGDAPVEVEKHLLDNFGNKISADILKVGHHGSSGSSLISFLEKVNPAYAIISVGKGNRYGHPSLRVLKRLERVGTNILRTDEGGDVVCELGSEVVCGHIN